VKRLSSWALPILLAVAGVALIIVGSLDLDPDPSPSLPPILTPTPVARASDTPSAEPSELGSSAPTPTPSPTPIPDDVLAVQLEVPSVGINVLVRQSADRATDSFPPDDAAYILLDSSQPGRGTNSYVFAHALNSLFKPLWNVQVGADVLVRMSDDSVLRYVVTEVRPNVPCPDPDAVTDDAPDLAGLQPQLG
jgi:hypothetical protein